MNIHEGLRILSIGKVHYPEHLSGHRLNHKAWSAMASRCERVCLVGVSTDRRASVSREGNITLHRIPRWPGLAGSAVFVVGALGIGLWLGWRRQIDVLDGSDPLSAGFSGVVLKWLTRLPLLLHVQAEVFSLPPERFSNRRIRWAKRLAIWCCNHADVVRTVSAKIADQAIASGVMQKKIVVLPSRCDVVQFDPSVWRERGVTIRRELGWSDCRVMLFVGSLNLSKAVGTIIDAFSSLVRTHTDVRLLVVGDGPLSSDLERQAQSLGVAGLVRFYGRVSYDEVPALLAAGDLFVSPSLDEGMPRSVLEAMAMQLPVIVTPVGGNPEIVATGVNGLLVPPMNVAALGAAMAELLASPERMRQMGVAGRERVVADHDFEVQIDRLASLHRLIACL